MTAAQLDRHAADAVWWNGGGALRTRVFDAISLLLPAGEQFLIDTMDAALAQPCADAALRADARRFIDEERRHQRAHRLDVQRIAAHAPTAALEARIAAAIEALGTLPLPTRLAFAAAFEALTGLLSREVLRPRGCWLADDTTLQARLWRWHCREEIAHGPIALAMRDAAGVGALRRGLVFVAAALYLASDLLVLTAALCRHDRRAGRIGRAGQAAQAAGFALRTAPAWARIAAGGLRYLFTGRGVE